MKRRLLFVSNLFPDNVERYRGLDNATILHQLTEKWDIRVLSLRPCLLGWASGRSDLIPRPEDVHFQPSYLSVPYIPKLGSRWNHQLMAMRLGPAMRQIAGALPWDVLLGAWLFPDGCALVKCSDRRPVHIIAQGSDVHRYLKDRHRRAAIAEAVSEATSVITRSQSLAKMLIDATGNAKRIRSVANGVDAGCFCLRDQQTARRTLGIAPSCKVMLFVGNFLPVKDPLLTVRTFIDLRQRDPRSNWNLVMVGKGPLRSQVEAEVRRLGLSGHVTLTGPKSASEVSTWMAAADVLTLTSHNEGLPNVVMESLACGLPVVATNVGGISEMLDADWKGVLCNTREPTALADAILRAVATSDRQRIATHCARSWADTAATYHEILSGNTKQNQ
jgi:glycosyltransferase involved in cell wall biosynthesis